MKAEQVACIVQNWFSEDYGSAKKSKKQRLIELRNNFRANSLEGSSTYRKCRDAQEAFMLLDIPFHVVRSMKVGAIENMVASKVIPDSYSSVIVRLCVHVNWDDIKQFLKERLRIDRFCRLLLTFLENSNHDALEYVRTTTDMVNEDLKIGIRRQCQFDVRKKLGPKLASEFDLEETIHRLGKMPNFHSWVKQFHFTGTTGGPEQAKADRTADWMVRMYIHDMRKKGIVVVVPPSADRTPIKVKKAPGTVSVEIGVKKCDDENLTSETGESIDSDDNSEMKDADVTDNGDCNGEREMLKATKSPKVVAKSRKKSSNLKNRRRQSKEPHKKRNTHQKSRSTTNDKPYANTRLQTRRKQGGRDESEEDPSGTKTKKVAVTIERSTTTDPLEPAEKDFYKKACTNAPSIVKIEKVEKDTPPPATISMAETPTSEKESMKMAVFCDENKDQLHILGKLVGIPVTEKYLAEHPYLACDWTANWLTIECLNLAIDRKDDKMCVMARQCIIIQYLLELSKNLKADPTNTNMQHKFFKKFVNAEPHYMTSFHEEVVAFQDRIRKRAQDKRESTSKFRVGNVRVSPITDIIGVILDVDVEITKPNSTEKKQMKLEIECLNNTPTKIRVDGKWKKIV